MFLKGESPNNKLDSIWFNWGSNTGVDGLQIKIVKKKFQINDNQKKVYFLICKLSLKVKNKNATQLFCNIPPFHGLNTFH